MKLFICDIVVLFCFVVDEDFFVFIVICFIELCSWVMVEEFFFNLVNNFVVVEVICLVVCCFLVNVFVWWCKLLVFFLGVLVEVLWLFGLNDELVLVVICFLSVMENFVVCYWCNRCNLFLKWDIYLRC